MRDAIGDLETRQNRKWEEAEVRARGQDARLDKMDAAVAGLHTRLHGLESGSTAAPSSDSGGMGMNERRNRLAFIVGDFQRDTRRDVVVNTINAALKNLDVVRDTDREPFTTGPRRSFALPAEVRREESNDHAREKLYRVMNSILRAKIVMKGQEKPMWAGPSRSKFERERASHCGVIRQTTRHFNPESLSEAEFDYNAGTTWMGNSMVGSVLEKMSEEMTKHNIFTFSSKTNQPWVNVTLLAREMQSDVDEVQDFLRDLYCRR